MGKCDGNGSEEIKQSYAFCSECKELWTKEIECQGYNSHEYSSIDKYHTNIVYAKPVQDNISDTITHNTEGIGACQVVEVSTCS